MAPKSPVVVRAGHTGKSATDRRRRRVAHSLTRVLLGRSVQGRPLEAYLRSAGDAVAMVLAGMHGDEPKSVYLARRLMKTLAEEESPEQAVTWIVLPVVNPDGYAKRKRRNARGVDLNRNFPTRNWQPSNPRSRMYGGLTPTSEPETRAVLSAIERWMPTRIVTIHSISHHRFCNNYDGPAEALAARMSRSNGYPVTSSMGYPTPGSFGTWAGIERHIPVITLELPSHHSPVRCWRENRQALLEVGGSPRSPIAC